MDALIKIAVDAGFEAYIMFETRESNPYPPQSDLWKSWDSGWILACCIQG